MNKKIQTPIFSFLFNIIFLVVFNAIFFLVGKTEHPLSVWISYGTIHLAYLMLLFTPVITSKSNRTNTLSSTVRFISLIYFIVELIVGIIFILIASETYMSALLVQMIILAIYLAILLYVMISNKTTSVSIKRQDTAIAYIKTASSRVKLLLDKTDDKQANRAIESVYDMLHSSPAQSIPALKALETEIFDKIEELERAVFDNQIPAVISLAKEINALAEQRNVKLNLQN